MKIRKKLNFKDLIKIIINFFWKLIKNWWIRIYDKYKLVKDTIKKWRKVFKIFRKKFKPFSKFQRSFKILKLLLELSWYFIRLCFSLFCEVFFIFSLIEWIKDWINFIRFLGFLVTESVFITGIFYSLCFVLLMIFGVWLGFLFDVYREDEAIYLFTILLLLQIFYRNGFYHLLLEYLHNYDLSLESITGEQQFSKFSFKTVEKIQSRPLKIILKQPDKISQILLPILDNPFVKIDIEVILEESTNYQFEFFKFYPDVNKKMKS